MHSQKQSTFPAITEILSEQMVHILFCSLSVAVDLVSVEATFYDLLLFLLLFMIQKCAAVPPCSCYSFSLIFVLTQKIPLFL